VIVADDIFFLGFFLGDQEYFADEFLIQLFDDMQIWVLTELYAHLWGCRSMMTLIAIESLHIFTGLLLPSGNFILPVIEDLPFKTQPLLIVVFLWILMNYTFLLFDLLVILPDDGVYTLELTFKRWVEIILDVVVTSFLETQIL